MRRGAVPAGAVPGHQGGCPEAAGGPGPPAPPRLPAPALPSGPGAHAAVSRRAAVVAVTCSGKPARRSLPRALPQSQLVCNRLAVGPHGWPVACWARCATQCAELLLAPDHTSAAATLPRPSSGCTTSLCSRAGLCPAPRSASSSSRNSSSSSSSGACRQADRLLVAALATCRYSLDLTRTDRLALTDHRQTRVTL